MLRRRLSFTPPSRQSATPRTAPPTISPNASEPSSRCICARHRSKPGDAPAMEIKSHQADRFVARPPAGLVAALVYGPDQGMVRERATALAKSVVSDLNDPFRVSELDEATLDADPARLWDEAAALSMIGGRS